MQSDMNAKRLRVLMVSTSYPSTAQDWKGRFIFDMTAALGRRSDVNITLWAPPGELPAGTASVVAGDDGAWLGCLLERGGIAHLLRRQPITGLAAAAGLLRRLRQVYRRVPSDVIHVNWLQNALPLAGTRIPALVTVLGSDFGLLRLPGMVPFLRRALAGRAAILAPNAAWMAPELERRFGDMAEVRPIPFGVESRWFSIARQYDAPPRWLAITRLTRAKLGDLFAWGEGLFDSGRELHLFGPMQEQVDLPPWIVWHGPTHPEELQRVWFPVAAGLVTLSRHNEGRPQVLLEAMAAGLPVIVSNLPAHRDFVKQGETGWLAETREALADGLRALEDPHTNRHMGETARQWVHAAVGDWNDCAARYAAAYRDLQERACLTTSSTETTATSRQPLFASSPAGRTRVRASK